MAETVCNGKENGTTLETHRKLKKVGEEVPYQMHLISTLGQLTVFCIANYPHRSIRLLLRLINTPLAVG